MPSTETFCSWLLYSALVSLAVLALGSGAVLLCRQPARRLRIIELSLAGCLIAPWLGMIPGYPQLAIGRLAHALSETGPFFVEKTLSADNRLAGNMDWSPSAMRGGQDEAWPPMVSDLPSRPIAEPAETPAHAWNVGTWLVALYLLGVAIGVAWWLAGVAALTRILWTAHPAPPHCRRLLMEIAGRRSTRVRLLASRRAKQPFASVGVAVQLPPQRATWRRAVIVLPEDLCDDEQAVRWALAHEWTHIEQHDFRAWFAAGLARVLFFYQPLVWWLRRQLRLCQDYVADARASRQAPQPEDYAEFLTIRAAAGSLHPAMVGLGMGFRKSELYRRVVMLVQNRTLESRPPRLWSVSVTCAALVLIAAVAALTIAPQRATGSASADDAQHSDTSPLNTGGASGTPSLFTAQLPCGVSVELLGVSDNPSKDKPWWRPGGLPLAERPYQVLGASVGGNEDVVQREFAVLLRNLPAEPVSTRWRFTPPSHGNATGSPECLLKHEGELHAIAASLPADTRTATVRVGVASGLWQTVAESAEERATGSSGTGIIFSEPGEKDGNVTAVVAHDIVGPEVRVVAVGLDGREHRSTRIKILGARNIKQITATFAKLSLKDVKVFRLQTRPYDWVEFRNVSLRPGQKTDVQIAAAAADGIQPLDLLTIRVVGTMIDQPIDGVYLVEPSGKVTLGPCYGRVELKGLTIEAAEAAIQKQLTKTLARTDVQVTAAGHATQWRSGQLPVTPYRISPNDLLQIQVVGAILNQPIDGNFAVEPSGTVPLGPAYGRAEVKGLTLEEAEQAIVKQLTKVLKRPAVSVTLAGWKSDALLKADREAATARHDRALKRAEQRRKAREAKKRERATGSASVSPSDDAKKHFDTPLPGTGKASGTPPIGR